VLRVAIRRNSAGWPVGLLPLAFVAASFALQDEAGDVAPRARALGPEGDDARGRIEEPQIVTVAVDDGIARGARRVRQSRKMWWRCRIRVGSGIILRFSSFISARI
jgi:hypothetical protein